MKLENEYLPNFRSDYNPSEEELKSHSESGSYTILPSPVLDPIVSNNIVWQEGDYTEPPLNTEKLDIKASAPKKE